MIKIVEVTLTKISIFRKRAMIMNKPVIMTETCGVPNRGLIFPNNEGINPSRLRASGNRDAAMIPALAVAIKAKAAPNPMMIVPGNPKSAPEPSMSGNSEPSTRSAGKIPVVIITTAIYNPVTITSDNIKARGSTCPESYTSSAMLVTFSSPPNATNTNPAVPSNPPRPCGAKGWNRRTSTVDIPEKI